MARNAELGFGVLHRRAQRDCAAARRVREPRVSHVDQEIHARAHRLVRIFVRRHAVFVGVQLIRGMIGGNPHVVLVAGLKDAGAELVKSRIILGRLNLVDELSVGEWDHIRLSLRVLAYLEDVHVERDVAIRHIQHKVDQRGCFSRKVNRNHWNPLSIAAYPSSLFEGA